MSSPLVEIFDAKCNSHPILQLAWDMVDTIASFLAA